MKVLALIAVTMAACVEANEPPTIRDVYPGAMCTDDP
jgi:hypothetical protein